MSAKTLNLAAFFFKYMISFQGPFYWSQSSTTPYFISFFPLKLSTREDFPAYESNHRPCAETLLIKTYEP